MFSGELTRTFALAVVCAQVIASVAVVAVIPVPQSAARMHEPAAVVEAPDQLAADSSDGNSMLFA